eukprot:TRINITY_DN14146_c0_g1_i1.p1 TRINITY_DN14146_c0_g1~~TRINITY_DN14146_c0_g1_i1.p1  ORF type:complete len:382 (-),score=69.50 TRINITY_DN14146_c0_g1_i1:148-1248(-)
MCIRDRSSGGHTTVAISDKGEVFVAGKNKWGRLGLPATSDSVKAITKVPGVVAISMVSCGNFHTLLLKSNNTVLATGHNKSGELGLGDKQDRFGFTPLPSLTNIVAIAAGDGYSLFLNADDGSVLSSGKAELNGQGLSKDALVPAPLKTIQGERITCVAAGFVHAACCNEAGALYTWGKGSFFQLGHGTATDETVPKRVLALSEAKIVQVSCSKGEKWGHTGCIDDQGFAYSWGSGYKGKLGQKESWSHKDPGDEPLPKKIDMGDVRFSSFECGGIHSCLLTTDGKLLSFGCGSDGRLGHSESENYVYLYKEAYPREITAFSKGVAIKISCSYYHNIALVQGIQRTLLYFPRLQRKITLRSSKRQQ